MTGAIPRGPSTLNPEPEGDWRHCYVGFGGSSRTFEGMTGSLGNPHGQWMESGKRIHRRKLTSSVEDTEDSEEPNGFGDLTVSHEEQSSVPDQTYRWDIRAMNIWM